MQTRFQYLVEGGGDLRTFELVLNELGLIRHDYERMHILLRVIAASKKFMTALVALKVSETLAISIWYNGAGDHELQSSLDDELQDIFQDLMDQLSLGMRTTAMKQEPELLDRKSFKAGPNYGNMMIVNSYKLSWFLSPQSSDEQSTNISGASTSTDGENI